MQHHQWQAYCLGKPSPKLPHLVKIRVKATGKVITASSYGAGWLTPSGVMYTRHTATYLGSIKSEKV